MSSLCCALMWACDPGTQWVDEGMDTGFESGGDPLSRFLPELQDHSALGGNVLVIFLDDVGVDKVSGYEAHPTPPQTPNIDGLIDEGIRFDRAYAYPTCSPSRAALMTGRYGARTGIGHVISVEASEDELALAEITIPEMLEISPYPYTTAITGKWHLKSFSEESVATNPLDQGFDYHAGPLANPGNSLYDSEGSVDYFHWEKSINGEVAFTDTYLTTDTTNEAIGQIKSMPEPWFLYVPYNAPHEPVHEPPEDLYTTPLELGSELALYNAMMESVDTEIGRLLASIPEEVRKRTTIMVIGDNGTPEFAIEKPWDSTRNKGSLYEGGVRVPWVVSGPFVRQGGKVVDSQIHLVDVFSTVAQIAEVDLELLGPAETPLTLDGRSLLPHLVSPGLYTGRLFSYNERFVPNGPPPYDTHERSIRNDHWKYVRSWNGQAYSDALYNMEVDLWSEGENLLLQPTLGIEATQALGRMKSTMTWYEENLDFDYKDESM